MKHFSFLIPPFLSQVKYSLMKFVFIFLKNFSSVSAVPICYLYEKIFFYYFSWRIQSSQYNTKVIGFLSFFLFSLKCRCFVTSIAFSQDIEITLNTKRKTIQATYIMNNERRQCYNDSNAVSLTSHPFAQTTLNIVTVQLKLLFIISSVFPGECKG